MPKVKITNAFVKKVPVPKDKVKIEYFDTQDIGFMLEVRKSGNKTYYYRYNQNSKTILKKIANSEFVDANTARQIILKLKKAHAEQNLDIYIPKKINTLSLNEFYLEFYLPYVKKHVKSYMSNIGIFKNHILPILGSTPMNNVKKIDIMKIHLDMIHKKALKPATANKLLIFLSQAYRLANEFDVIKDNYNPVDNIKHFEENNEKQRFLTTVESKRLINAVALSKNIHLKYIIPMLLLSGARKSEVLNAKFEDFDEILMLWIIPISKNGKKRILPLTQELYTIVKQIPNNKTPYLFASPITNKPYVNIYPSWNTARIKAKLPDVRMHDLRHTFASALVNAKCSLYEVQILLGHSNSKMTQRYAHLSNESLHKAASNAEKLLK